MFADVKTHSSIYIIYVYVCMDVFHEWIRKYIFLKFFQFPCYYDRRDLHKNERWKMETGTKKFWISKLVRTRGLLGKENIMGMKDC